ncbi:MAG: hypothetical protein GY810_11755 [Aureispira sp.]|nr:hypothetical protein [Aureispira sp.]
MKKTTTYDLVKSLTKSEKRYFKLFSNMQNRSKGNTLLFDLMDKMEVYDEKKLVKKLKKTSVGNNLSIAKKQLYEKLMEALRVYHKTKHPEAKVLSILTDIRLLYGKQQYETCRELIKKGTQIATEYELFAELLLLLDWGKRRGIIQPMEHVSLDHSLKTYDSFKNAVAKLDNQNEYWKIGQLLFSHSRAYAKTRNKEEHELATKVIQNPFLNDPTNALSSKALIYYHTIPVVYYSYFEEGKKFEEATETSLEYIKMHPFLMHLDVERYLVTAHNLLFAYWSSCKYTKGNQLIQEIEQVETTYQLQLSPHQLIYQFGTIYSNKLLFNIRLGIFSNQEEVDYIETFLEKHNKEIYLYTQSKVKYTLALYHFINANYDKVHLRISEILQASVKANKYFPPIALTRLLNLMMQYELENYEIGLSLLRGQDYYYKDRNKHGFEIMILKFFKKIFQTFPHSKEEHLLFLDLQEKIDETLQDRNDKFYCRWLHIDIWVASKIAKKPFKAFLIEQNKE